MQTLIENISFEDRPPLVVPLVPSEKNAALLNQDWLKYILPKERIMKGETISMVDVLYLAKEIGEHLIKRSTKALY